jgi:CDP-4-dehydro-6-deoxyglucose reductase, E1
MKNYKDKLNKLIDYFNNNKKERYFNYPLLDDALSNEDIIKGMEVLLKKKITMGEITERFEYEFAKFLNVKYALMVNSGSSANLLASFALVNPQKNNFLKRGDEFLIQSLCWSTSLWPLVQAGLKPKFIDVDLDTLNINENIFEKSITKKTKAAMLVHVLGNSTNMKKISNIIKKKNLYLIEDTCESLGAKYNSKFLGTFGDFGTYSFYYSHQITSGEGGMIVCNKKEDYKLINILRAHGWDRGINKSPKNKNTFNFINSGFNLRPLDITAAIGMNQFKRLNKFKRIRNENREKIIKALYSSSDWKNQLQFINYSKEVEPSWFGLPMLIDKKYLSKKKRYIQLLNKLNIETRPIISGNFMNQKCIDLYNLNPKKLNFNNSQEIEDRGFFIGLHTQPISNEKLKRLVKSLLLIESI